MLGRLMHIDIVQAQYIQSAACKKPGKLLKALRTVFKTPVSEPERRTGVTAFDDTVHIIPAVDHAVRIHGLLYALRKRTSGALCHEIAVCAVKNAVAAAANGDRSVCSSDFISVSFKPCVWHKTGRKSGTGQFMTGNIQRGFRAALEWNILKPELDRMLIHYSSFPCRFSQYHA